MQASSRDRHASDDLVSRRCVSSCRSTDFKEISSSSPTSNCSQIVTPRWPLTWTNVVTWTAWRSSSSSTVRWRTSDCRQLHFGSARLFSSPSLSIVWPNYQIYIQRLLWLLTSTNVTLSPKNVIINFQLRWLSTVPHWSILIGRCHDVIDQAQRWLVNRLTAIRCRQYVHRSVSKYQRTSIAHL